MVTLTNAIPSHASAPAPDRTVASYRLAIEMVAASTFSSVQDATVGHTSPVRLQSVCLNHVQDKCLAIVCYLPAYSGATIDLPMQLLPLLDIGEACVLLPICAAP